MSLNINFGLQVLLKRNANRDIILNTNRCATCFKSSAPNYAAYRSYWYSRGPGVRNSTSMKIKASKGKGMFFGITNTGWISRTYITIFVQHPLTLFVPTRRVWKSKVCVWSHANLCLVMFIIILFSKPHDFMQTDKFGRGFESHDEV